MKVVFALNGNLISSMFVATASTYAKVGGW
jgi:hypothetical protein